MTAAAPHTHGRSDGFSHEALFYAGIGEFTQRNAAFIREGLANDEPVLVMVTEEKIAALRYELGAEAERVKFLDMADAGRNPGRIISHWSDFAAGHVAGERPARGIGEPIWSGRGDDELLECQHHEALINVAFQDAHGFRLACPYDTETLPVEVIQEAFRTHPQILDRGQLRDCTAYDHGRARDHHAAPLPYPDAPTLEVRFDASNLDVLRRFVAGQAEEAGLSRVRSEDLVVAVNEAATNSIRHGGGSGSARLWTTGSSFVCEVRDRGVITQPVAGRVRPHAGVAGGHGLWIAHQICDLVQLRSGRRGTVVRLHMLLPGAL